MANAMEKYPERDVRMALLTRLHRELLATRAHCPEPSTPDHCYLHTADMSRILT